MKPTLVAPGAEVHPGEAPVLILAQERLGGGPVDRLGDVAPQVQAPVVVVIAGGVIAVVAVGAEVVDHRMIDGLNGGCGVSTIGQ